MSASKITDAILLSPEVRNVILGIVTEMIESSSSDPDDDNTSPPKRFLKANGTPQTNTKSKEKTSVTLTGDDGIIVVLNYTLYSHALFGDFEKTYASFKNNFMKTHTEIKYSPHLAFGKGWIIRKKKNPLPEIIARLKKDKIPFRQVERTKYENEIHNSKETVKEVEEVPESTEEKEDSDEEEVYPPKKKTKKEKSKKKPNVSKNKYGNLEDEDTGYVFRKLPVGKKGKKRAIVVGLQDPDAPKKDKGLDSVYALTEDDVEICEEYGWNHLTSKMLKIIKKTDKKLASALKEVFERIIDDSDEEDEDSDDDESESSDSE